MRYRLDLQACLFRPNLFRPQVGAAVGRRRALIVALAPVGFRTTGRRPFSAPLFCSFLAGRLRSTARSRARRLRSVARRRSRHRKPNSKRKLPRWGHELAPTLRESTQRNGDERTFWFRMILSTLLIARVGSAQASTRRTPKPAYQGREGIQELLTSVRRAGGYLRDNGRVTRWSSSAYVHGAAASSKDLEVCHYCRDFTVEFLAQIIL